ncbi:MAG: hypothetical protein AAF533_12380 [Acidobacteriota bacterium]
MDTLRRDFYLTCDANGFSLVSADALDRLGEDDDPMPLVESQAAVLVSMIGDDYFHGRLIVGGELTEAEEREWLARITARLELPSGELLVGAGCDPDVLADAHAAGDDGHAFELSPGSYRVDIYTHAPAMNARELLPGELNTVLGAWFRDSHPGEPFPAWLAAECRDLADEYDPEHADDWVELANAVRRGALAVAEDPRACIGFVLHLQPLAQGEDLSRSEVDDEGWHPPETGLRRPVTCPRGLPTEGVGQEEHAGFLSELRES